MVCYYGTKYRVPLRAIFRANSVSGQFYRAKKISDGIERVDFLRLTVYFMYFKMNRIFVVSVGCSVIEICQKRWSESAKREPSPNDDMVLRSRVFDLRFSIVPYTIYCMVQYAVACEQQP